MGNLNSQLKVKSYKWAKGSDGYDVQLDYLIEGVLPAQSFGVVYGPSGSFKSFLIMGWAAHVASGIEWDGRKVKQAGVLYVVAEGGIGAARRVKGWEKEYLGGKQLENYYSICVPVHIANPEALRMLQATIDEIETTQNTKIELVIFDTLARCFNGADENSTKDMNYFISGCDMLKATKGVSVLVVHHSGKSEANAARGSSALRAACDFEFKVTREAEDETSEPALILSCEKMKDDEPIAKRSVKLKPVYVFTNQEGKKVYSLAADSKPELASAKELVDARPLSPAQTALWEIVRGRVASSQSTSRALVLDDFKALGFPQKNFSRSVQRLIDRGLLEERDGDFRCMPSSK
ncbi:helicase RepA family protein [Vibrio brasiliensis]|uniref:AAA family ATPase n=1 Tax=Vibrio brasiliensis LMG 20546 TaxID=945543 RepID=E8LNP5_9VIBR|nr:helicase RepA family protein [Vibrio brasiliensis]EGA67690.1 hypothetical protein VIBR0546_04482 [Vibrio brasiliensis LMG 20546]